MCEAIWSRAPFSRSAGEGGRAKPGRMRASGAPPHWSRLTAPPLIRPLRGCVLPLCARRGLLPDPAQPAALEQDRFALPDVGVFGGRGADAGDQRHQRAGDAAVRDDEAIGVARIRATAAAARRASRSSRRPAGRNSTCRPRAPAPRRDRASRPGPRSAPPTRRRSAPSAPARARSATARGRAPRAPAPSSDGCGSSGEAMNASAASSAAIASGIAMRSARPIADAWARPRRLSGMSRWPCRRPSAL